MLLGDVVDEFGDRGGLDIARKPQGLSYGRLPHAEQRIPDGFGGFLLATAESVAVPTHAARALWSTRSLREETEGMRFMNTGRSAQSGGSLYPKI